MKTFVLSLFAVLGTAAMCAAADEFVLECTIKDKAILCALQNASDHEIRYSSYTIGYHEAVVVEVYDESTDSWLPVQFRDKSPRLVKSAGAFPGHVRTVVPGATVPPENSNDESPIMSFTLQMAEYDLPPHRAMLRVKQVMGTLLGSDLPVWKGTVTSPPIEYPPR